MVDDARLQDIEDRLTALEALSGQPRTPALPGGDDRFWVLAGLRADTGTPAEGAVVYAGRVLLPTGEEYEWQMGSAADDARGTAETDPASAAPLAALGHAVRLRLLREVLVGTRTTAGLAALPGLGTTGQLHHHLRQLVSAGWLRPTARGSYAVPPERVVPLHVILAAVTA